MLTTEPVRWLDSGVNEVVASIRPDYLQSTKELVRSALHSTGMSGVVELFRRMRGISAVVKRSDGVAARFASIYRERAWVHSQDQESLSGVGSSRAATAGLLPALFYGMSHLGCQSLVDIGCGDWNWMQHETFECDYIGVDVVDEVIMRNQRFARRGVRFAVCNAIEQELPQADMALCREVLFHLSFADARAVLRNIAQSARFVCATTDADILFNSNIRSGDYRRLNLMRAPFSLPLPIAVIPDSAVSTGRLLAVWPTHALRLP